MAEQLSGSARRVQEFLSDRGFALKVCELPDSTRTAVQAAQSIGCEVAQIAKSLIFRDTEKDCPVLVVASGANRVNLEKIQSASGLQLERADGKFVKERVGFAIGGVPPSDTSIPWKPCWTRISSATQSSGQRRERRSLSFG